MAKRLAEIMTTDTEPQQLPDTLYGTLIEAVRKVTIGTQVLSRRFGPQSIKGSSIDVVTSDRDSSAVHVVGEGQEVPIDLAETSTFNMKPVKYGLRPVVTKEMQEDGQWDMIQHNIAEAGYRMGEKLDALILDELDTAAALTTDDNGDTRTAHNVSGGAAITVKNITDAMNYLEADNYKPTDLILDTAVANDVRNIDTFVEADKAGVTNPSQSLIGRIFGMNVWVTTNGTANYAYVIDRNHALCLAEKRPITIERYDDVTRDLSGVVVTSRWKARYLRPDAIARITTS